MHPILTNWLLNTLSIYPLTLYIVADVMLGFLIDRDSTLLALPSDRGGSPQEAAELDRTMRCWTLCLVYACNEGISTKPELWLCKGGGEGTHHGGGGNPSAYIELCHIIQ